MPKSVKSNLKLIRRIELKKSDRSRVVSEKVEERSSGENRSNGR